jgi:sulfur-carrier protein
MKTIIRIPAALRRFTRGLDEVEVEASTVAEAIEALERDCPGVRDRILHGDSVRKFVNLYVRDEDIRFLNGLRTVVQHGDVIAIVSAIAGG